MPIPKNLDIAAIIARGQPVMARSFLWHTTAPQCLKARGRLRRGAQVPYVGVAA